MGHVNPIVGMADDNDAAGDREGPTDVKSWRIGQTFLVGNGKDRFYNVPSDATRLYLGFADGYLYLGHPGWYGNNAGELSVTVTMARRTG